MIDVMVGFHEFALIAAPKIAFRARGFVLTP
jgi:hypothetical protein